MKKLIANIMYNGRKLKTFLLRSGSRQGCPILATFAQYSTGNPARTIRQVKEVKIIQIRREEVRFPSFFMTWSYIKKTLNIPYKKLLDITVRNLNIKLWNSKSRCKRQLHFYTLNMDYLKRKLRKSSCNTSKNNKILRNK